MGAGGRGEGEVSVVAFLALFFVTARLEGERLKGLRIEARERERKGRGINGEGAED